MSRIAIEMHPQHTCSKTVCVEREVVAETGLDELRVAHGFGDGAGERVGYGVGLEVGTLVLRLKMRSVLGGGVRKSLPD